MTGANRAHDFISGAVSIIEQLQGPNGGQLPKIWQTVQPWVTRLLASAQRKWLPIIVQESPCLILNPDGKGGWVKCVHPAIALCDCCGKPCCLMHCRVDSNGGAICFPCVSVAHKIAREGGISQDRAKLDAARATLGWTEEEQRKAYKRLSKKFHTDSQTTGDAAKFMEVQEAWKLLTAQK